VLVKLTFRYFSALLVLRNKKRKLELTNSMLFSSFRQYFYKIFCALAHYKRWDIIGKKC